LEREDPPGTLVDEARIFWLLGFYLFCTVPEFLDLIFFYLDPFLEGSVFFYMKSDSIVLFYEYNLLLLVFLFLWPGGGGGERFVFVFAGLYGVDSAPV